MSRVTMVDVAVGAASVVFFGGVAVATLAQQRETNDRIRCASNLRQIGQAILLYSNENRNAYPRTTVEMDGPPVWGTPYADDANAAAVANVNADPFASETGSPAEVFALKPHANDVTAALFLLLRTQDLVPSVFVCPSTRAKQFGFGGQGTSALHFTNFPGKTALARSLNYSYQNPYASSAAVGRGFRLDNAAAAEFAVMADMNPGGDALLTLKRNAPIEELRKGNSLNHTFAGNAEGQNVLYGDGHVEFQQSPFVGVGRDNIYVANDRPAARNVKREGEPAFAASPADAYDSILLPTAAALGTDQPLPAVVPVPDGAAAAQPFAGTYSGRINQHDMHLRMRPVPAHLTIDDQTLTAECGKEKVSYRYTVAGMRGESLVLTLQGEGVAEGAQADLTMIEGAMYIDADEPTGLLKGDAGGAGWSKAHRAK